MSLALSFVLRAAAEDTPDRVVDLAGESMTCALLEARTGEVAVSLLENGYRPGDSLSVLDTSSPERAVRGLAGSRIGLILTDLPATTSPGPSAELPDWDVLETDVASASPLMHLSRGQAATHGEFIQAVLDRVAPHTWPPSFLRLAQQLIGTGEWTT